MNSEVQSLQCIHNSGTLLHCIALLISLVFFFFNCITQALG